MNNDGGVVMTDIDAITRFRNDLAQRRAARDLEPEELENRQWQSQQIPAPTCTPFADTPLPILSEEAHTAEVYRTLKIMRMEADFEDELMEEWHAYPSLRWRQFLTMKLNEARRTCKDFTTIRSLQNLLAKA